MRFHFRKDGKLYKVNDKLALSLCFAYDAGIEFDSYEEARKVLCPELDDAFVEVPELPISHSWVNSPHEETQT